MISASLDPDVLQLDVCRPLCLMLRLPIYIYLTINQLLITYILPNYLMIQGFSNVFQQSLASALISDLQAAGYDAIQWCLVDCPGHASLIRTVIGDVATGATGGVRGEGESS